MTGTKIDASGVTFPDSSVQASASSVGPKVAKQTVNYDDGSPVTIVTLPAGSYVIACAVNVTTAFAGTSPTVEVGDASDDNGFATLTVTDCTNTGWKPTALNTSVYLYNSTNKKTFKLYAASTAVIATIGGASLTQGVIVVYIIYFDLSVV